MVRSLPQSTTIHHNQPLPTTNLPRPTTAYHSQPTTAVHRQPQPITTHHSPLSRPSQILVMDPATAYLSLPLSGQMCCSGPMPPNSQATQGCHIQWLSFAEDSGGSPWSGTPRPLLQPVLCAPRTRTPISLAPACYALCPSLTGPGHT